MDSTATVNNGSNHSNIRLMKYKFDGSNYPMFVDEARSHLPAYGAPGRAIIDDVPIVDEEPVRPRRVRIPIYEELDAEGNRPAPTWLEQDWDMTLHEGFFQSKYRSWLERCNKRRQDEANLWLFIILNVTEDVLARLKANREEFQRLLKTVDTLGLWKLLYQTYYGPTTMNGIAASIIRMKWQALKQVSDDGTIMPLQDYLNLFDSHLRMIIGTSSAPSHEDQVTVLIAGLDRTRYANVLHQIVSGVTPVATVVLADLKRQLLNIDGYILNGAEEERDHAVAMAVSTSGKKRKAKGDGNTREKLRKVVANLSEARKRKKKPLVCWNCKGKDHKNSECEKEKALCKKCGSKGHLSEFCPVDRRQNKSSTSTSAAATTSNTDKKKSAVHKANVLFMSAPTDDNNVDEEDDDEETEAIFKHFVRVLNSGEASSSQTQTVSDDEETVLSEEASLIQAEDDEPWVIYVDTGATINVFKDDSFVRRFAVHGYGHSSIPQVFGVNGDPLPVTGGGFIRGIGRFVIVPSSTCNLLSIPELVRRGHYQAVFSQGLCKIVPITNFSHQQTISVSLDNENCYAMNTEQLETLVTRHVVSFLTFEERQTYFSLAQQNQAEAVRRFHMCLCHPSDKTLINALNAGCILGTRFTAKDVKNAELLFGPCPHCLAGKVTRPHYTASLNPPADSVGSILHCDIFCFAEPTIGGNRFYLLVVDEFSGFLIFHPLTSKSTPSLESAFNEVIAFYACYQHKLSLIETDSESNLAACATFLASRQVLLRQVPPYQHAQRVERYVRTILDKVRTVLDALPYNLPRNLLGELIYYVITYMNDLPNSTHKTLSPRMLVTGTKLDLHTRILIPFGILAMFHIAGKNQDKFLPRSEMGIVLGPADGRTYSAVRCYIFEKKRVYIRHHFEVLKRLPLDMEFRPKSNALNAQVLTNMFLRPDKTASATLSFIAAEYMKSAATYSHSSSSPGEESSSSQEGMTVPAETEEASSEEMLNYSQTSQTSNAPSTDESPATNNEMDVVVAEEEDIIDDPLLSVVQEESFDQESESFYLDALNDGTSVKSFEANLRRSSRRPKNNWTDGPAKYMEHVRKLTVSQALLGPYALQTRLAVLDEIQNMLNYQVGTYIRLTDITKRGNIVATFMFIKHKTKPNGEYDKTKARLVANGAKQKKHLYDLISSSTVNLPSVFLLFNIACAQRLRIVAYDVKGAFLHARFSEDDEPIYIKIPKDVAAEWIKFDPSAAEYLTDKGDLYLLLLRYIYGLKQSPLKFQEHLRDVLVSAGYQVCEHDECILFKRVGDEISILSTHVDDIFQISNSDDLINALHTVLIEVYQDVVFHDKADAYLGMTILQSEDRSTISLSQTGLIKKLLDEHLADNVSPLSTPATPDLFSIDETSPRLEDNRHFLSIVMSLMYLARLTRPDILLAVTFLASRAHVATSQDLSKLGRILRYLKRTRDTPLVICCNEMNFRLCCHVDASFGCHPDGKSHSGYTIFCGTGADNSILSFLHSRSVKQKLSALSSTDAEIFAVVDSLRTITWIRNLLMELGVVEPHAVEIFQDNKSAILMFTEASKLRRSRHLLVKLSYIKDAVAQGFVTFTYVATLRMHADMHTKPLMGELFVSHCRAHGL